MVNRLRAQPGPNLRRAPRLGRDRATIGLGRRKQLRLRGYDYRSAGAYFVTACAHDGLCLFGDVCDDEFVPNDSGWIVQRCWEELPFRFASVELDAYVVMPNHVHGVLVFVGAGHARPLPVVIGSFKAAVTRQIDVSRGQRTRVWQRGYHERIVRDERELEAIRRYIADNPIKWAIDRENPAARA